MSTAAVDNIGGNERALSPESLNEAKINASLVVASGLLWAAFWFLNAWVFSHLQYGTGISLVYFPAGVRLAIVLIFGVWGAIGIALSNPLLFIATFGSQSLVELLLNSVIAGFVPLVVVNACGRLLGIKATLSNLRPIHLPILAMAVSVFTPLAFNIMFLIYDLKPVQDLWKNLSAMILGDFLGCMIALVLLKLLLPVYEVVVLKRSAN